MKFTISNQKSSSRAGIFHLLTSEPGSSSGCVGYKDLETDNTSSASQDCFGLKIETPNVIVYSRYGRIPHLTEDVERSLLGERRPQMRRIRLSELMEDSLGKSLNASKIGYKDLTGSQENAILFCSIHDSSQLSDRDVSLYAEEKTVSVWTNSGRRKVTPEEFMEALSVGHIPFAEALCDVSPIEASLKRIRKSVDRTLKHLDRCIELKQSNQDKYCTGLFGVVVGGSVIKERIRSAQETSKRDVLGFVLEGFDKIEDNFYDILQETMKFLPNDKVKILIGVFSPDQIIDAVSLGIDIVDNSYAFDATSRDAAMVFEFSRKRPKVQVGYSKAPADWNIDTRADFEICLKEQRFKEDFRPIFEGCNCYTCVKYSRAYINHLLVANEMLAQVLLMIHNTQHLKRFIDEIRKAVLDGTIYSLKDQLRNART